MIPSYRAASLFVLNFSLSNKFFFRNSFKLPKLEKVVLDSFIQDLDTHVSNYYLRSLKMMELITTQRAVIKTVKKTLKGKKLYQVVVSHNVVLRRELLHDFLNFCVYFLSECLEKKFLKVSRRFNDNGSYYFRIPDITVLPGLNEEFFRWPYSLDCFFVSKKIRHDELLSRFFLRYIGFAFLYFDKEEIVEEED